MENKSLIERQREQAAKARSIKAQKQAEWQKAVQGEFSNDGAEKHQKAGIVISDKDLEPCGNLPQGQVLEDNKGVIYLEDEFYTLKLEYEARKSKSAIEVSKINEALVRLGGREAKILAEEKSITENIKEYQTTLKTLSQEQTKAIAAGQDNKGILTEIAEIKAGLQATRLSLELLQEDPELSNVREKIEDLAAEKEKLEQAPGIFLKARIKALKTELKEGERGLAQAKDDHLRLLEDFGINDMVLKMRGNDFTSGGASELADNLLRVENQQAETQEQIEYFNALIPLVEGLNNDPGEQ